MDAVGAQLRRQERGVVGYAGCVFGGRDAEFGRREEGFVAVEDAEQEGGAGFAVDFFGSFGAEGHLGEGVWCSVVSRRVGRCIRAVCDLSCCRWCSQ